MKNKLLKNTIQLFIISVFFATTSTTTTAQNFVTAPLHSNVNKVQPMTGIVFWSDNENALRSLGDKVQLEYSYLVYSDVVQNEGVYDWSSVDDLLASIAANERQAILRFRYTYPGETTPSVPKYIRDLTDYTNQIENVEGSSTYIPDWSSKALQDFTLEFFTKFAERYDGDARLAFVQVGFGSYSEYHLFEGSLRFGETFPTKEYQSIFLEHIDNTFTQTQWALSIDSGSDEYTPIAESENLRNLKYGLFDDSFLHEEHSLNDNEYNRAMWLSFGENRADNYVAGGELNYFSDRDQRTALNVEGPYGFTFEEMSAMYDISYMIGNDQLNYQTTERIEDAAMSTGYHFEVTNYSTNGSSTLVTITNNGIAPIYYDAFPTINGVKSTTSLKGLTAGKSRDFSINTEANGEDLTISCDRLVTGQKIQFDADIDAKVLSNATFLVENFSVETFPNPFANKLTIVNPKNKTITFQVFSILGNLLVNKSITETSNIDTSKLTPGMYIINIGIDDFSSSSVFIKE